MALWQVAGPPATIVGSLGGALLLPLQPQAVDLGVVQEEDGVVGRAGRAHVAADGAVDGAVRLALEPLAEVVVAGLGHDVGDGVRRDGPPVHVAGVKVAIVEVAGQAVRHVVGALVLHLEVLERPVPHAKVVDGLGTVDAKVGHLVLAPAHARRGHAVAADARHGIPDAGVGYVRVVERPVPVGQGALVAALAQVLLVQVQEPPVPGQELGHKVDIVVEQGVDVGEVGQAGRGQAPPELRGLLGHAEDGVDVLLPVGRGELAELDALLGVCACCCCVGGCRCGDCDCGQERGEDEIYGEHCALLFCFYFIFY